MKLLVTGGSGYVGAAILRRAPADWQIAATYLAHPIQQPHVAAHKRSLLAQEFSTANESQRTLVTFRVDIRDAHTIAKLFADFQPDAVIHTAALMFGDEMMTTNIDGSRTIARAATQHHTRVIHLSSDVIFDGEHAPYAETDSPTPITPYGKSKARAEQVVRDEFANPVIVRTSLVYGFDPIDPRTRLVVSGEMSKLFTDEYRCPIFVDDLADALIELAQNDFTGGLNVAGPQRLSRYEFGLKLAHALGVEIRFQSAVSASSPPPRPRDCTLDISRSRKILQTRLRSVDEVLAFSF